MEENEKLPIDNKLLPEDNKPPNNIKPKDIEDEMKVSYLDYAMSVIIGRALPDIRDGLKPVHRRVLYAMNEMGMSWNKSFKKSARIVGEVLGKYHPHGDTAVYDSIIRMVQTFSLRYPLIGGQGNFGSIDGDAAAAMRYTEIKLSKIAHEMLVDIDKETVEFTPNFDNSLVEPQVLPTKIPNLLINGSSGIAVGMATNIPPHNLGEIVDALILLIDNPLATIIDLLKIVKGPDFPTGAHIYGSEGIKEAYLKGKGCIRLRAKASIEEEEGRTTKKKIIISEIPYQVNKKKLLEHMGALVNEKKIEGVSDVRDESDKDGMRIVIELKKPEISEVILNQLYKHTSLETTFGIIMLSIVDNQPRVLGLREILVRFLAHRKTIVTRRTIYDLKKAEERAHILAGLLIALDHLDEVIKTIRSSKNYEEADRNLKERFDLSDRQSKAILEMRLQRLTGLEREKVKLNYKETCDLIEYYKGLLSDEKKIMEIIKKELLEIKETYADERRTQIMDQTQDVTIEDLIVEEDMVVIITHKGYIKRSPLSLYRIQKRKGQGLRGTTTQENDFVEHLFIASTHDYLMFFTDTGKAFWLKVYIIPESGRVAQGRALVNLLQLEEGEKITAILPVKEFEKDKYILMTTKKGIIKKTLMEEYSRPREKGIIAINVDPGDKLIAVKITDGKKDIMLGTKDGLAIRFHEEKVRAIGRVGRGVKGIALEEGDEVIGMIVLDDGSAILTVTESGYGKRTGQAGYRPQGRGGKGVINLKITERNGKVVGMTQVFDDDSIMMITGEGTLIWLETKGISLVGRNAQGIRLQRLGENQKVVAIAKLAEKEDGEDEKETESPVGTI
ncbi:MAG: DNA gyrase subunit A [bacterium]